MAIDVTITQRLFGTKTMPLEVILGPHMQYGHLEADHLIVGKRGEKEILVYHPNYIGRGFSVIWHPGEKKQLTLRLPMPAPEMEIRHFYAAVVRMAEYWKAKLNVDGQPMTKKVFMQGLEPMLHFNEGAIRRLADAIVKGEHEWMMLHSAMWPMAIGKEEANRFLESPAAFGDWLHEKQSMDVYHAVVQLYKMETGSRGVFVCVDECPTVYPNAPKVPFGVMDENGKPLVCDEWKVAFVPQSEKNAIGELDFADFAQRLGRERVSRYDAGHFLMQPLTEQEMRQLLE